MLESENRKIDVIIPVYKPGKELFSLLEMLMRQSVSVDRIILMNTEKKYFDKLVNGTDFYDRFGNVVEVYHLTKRKFDHGLTRHVAAGKSNAELFVMMTQDAMPADDKMLEHLIAHLKGEVAVSYARQLPKEDSNILEQISREFNYPARSKVKSKRDLDRLGIKTYFCSNVCAAYRKDIYEKLGGFVRHTIFNEDMIYAAKAVNKGYAIAYEADARVYHSHNYSVKEQLHRNFDLGVSQADHPEIFKSVRSESEGTKLVGRTVAELRARRCRKWIPYFLVQCSAKYTGYLLGKHYKKLPQWLALALTSNKEYWK